MDHERLLLWPAFGVKARSDRRAFWWVRPADDDEWVEDTSGNDPQNGPSVSASRTWTRRMARRSAQIGDLCQTGTTDSINSAVPVLTRDTHMTSEGELKLCSPTSTGELSLPLDGRESQYIAESISGVAVGSHLEPAVADIRVEESVALGMTMGSVTRPSDKK